MGIFNRKAGDDRSQFEFEDSFAKSEQASPSTPMPPAMSGSKNSKSTVPPTSNSPTRNKRRMSYSIEDAILLMRDLPSDQRDMVVSIVQKTLSSANISVTDILDDASRKLNRLGTRKSQLNKEIAELEAGIKERQIEIEKITKDSEETENVKLSFEAASGMQISSSSAAAPTASESVAKEHAPKASSTAQKSEAASTAKSQTAPEQKQQAAAPGQAQQPKKSGGTPPGIPSNSAS